MVWRLALLVVCVCALSVAGCSGPDAPKKPVGPTTQLPVDQNVRAA